MERDIKDWGGNIVALVAVVMVNAIASGLPLGGVTTAEVSARYESLFTPAGYAFAIWGLIYIALFAYVIYQARPVRRQNVKLAKISRPWQLSCAFNILWIFFWHYDFLLLSMLAMLGILLCLITIYRELGIAASPASTGPQSVCAPAVQYLYRLGLRGDDRQPERGAGRHRVGTRCVFSAETWTLFKLGIAGAIAATLICRRRDIAATLVVAWAAWAISVKQVAVPAVAGAAQTLTYAALLLVAFELVRLAQNRTT